MPVTTRKVVRDLRRRLTQSAAIAVTVLFGVLLFVASYDSFRNLRASYDQTYARTHFADLTATGGDPAALATAVAGDRAVGSIGTRTQSDQPMKIGATKLLGRVVAMPPDNDGIDRVDIGAGALPGPDEVLVERHAADTFGLRPGDQVSVFDGAAMRDVTVSGVAVSPEYLWPARNRQDVLGDPHAFAVLFAPQPLAEQLTGTAPNQTLVEMSSNATQADRDRVTAELRAAGATDVQTRADQPSNATLAEDLNGFAQLAVGFPLLFLTAGAIAEYVLITRLVQAERAIIGTLLAMGARRGTLIRHYLWYGVVVATVGAVAGVLAGAAATSAVTSAYTAALHVPDTVIEHRMSTAAIGLVLGVITGAVAALAPALAAARTAPADAMRGDGSVATRMGRLTRWSARWNRLPVVARMALRSLTRGRRRTFATMVGAVLALVLILSSVGMMTSMQAMLDTQFGTVQREDATVLTAPGANDVAAQLQSIPGITAVEPATFTRATVAANGHTYQTALTGFATGTSMHGFGRDLPAGGILAGKPLADQLGITAGDMVTITPEGAAPQPVRVDGFVDEPLGTQLYGTNDTVGGLTTARLGGYLVQFAADADHDRIRAAATNLPGVLAYTDTDALQAQFDKFLGLFWVFVVVMLVLGAVLAFTVIYVTMTVNLAERTTELATFRATGVSVGRLTAALAAENLVATALAAPFGVPAGIGAAWLFLRSFNSDLFTLELSLSWLATPLAVLAVLAAAAISQLPAARMVERIDIARVVRERAQ